MTRKVFAACVLSLAFANVGNAQGTASSAGTGANYTQAEVKQLVQTAHAPEQYTALANYYRARQESYLQRAAEEKKEWERRSENVMGVLAKYPRPVDSARNLYEYYTYKASEAGTLVSKYQNLAASGSLTNAQ